MFNASEANAAAAANKFRKVLYNDVESTIQAAVLEGDTECRVDVDLNTPREIINDMYNMLKDNGYNVDLYSVVDEIYFKIRWSEV